MLCTDDVIPLIAHIWMAAGNRLHCRTHACHHHISYRTHKYLKLLSSSINYNKYMEIYVTYYFANCNQSALAQTMRYRGMYIYFYYYSSIESLLNVQHNYRPWPTNIHSFKCGPFSRRMYVWHIDI